MSRTDSVKIVGVTIYVARETYAQLEKHAYNRNQTVEQVARDMIHIGLSILEKQLEKGP